MISNIHSMVPYGFEGKLVEVEGDMNRGLPAFNIVGMANKTINEAKERVRSAIVNSEFSFPDKKVTINLAPAELPKDGAYLDLPIALSILVLSGQLIKSDVANKAFVGELSLNGEIKPIKGIINIIEIAKRAGYREIYIPIKNLAQASLLNGIDVYGVESLQNLFLVLKGQASPRQADTNPSGFKTDNDLNGPIIDHVRGQKLAKRAMEIAVAGHHNILISGPPGAGKTLVGLDVAIKQTYRDGSNDPAKDDGAVYLSGNGPLVAVLNEALAQDNFRKAKARGEQKKLTDSRREVRKSIQMIHRYRDNMLAKIKNPVENGVLEIDPHKAVEMGASGFGEVEHVAIFDEAQRNIR